MATPLKPWASPAALTTLSRRTDNPFLTGTHATNSIATFTAACTSGKLGPALVPNLSTTAAEHGGVMQGDHSLALKPGQRIRAIRFHHLESPLLSSDDTTDPPYPVRYCAVEIAGVHSNVKLAAQTGVRTSVTVVGADGSEQPVTTKPSQPMIVFAPLASAVELVDGPLQLQEFCTQHPARPALPVSQPQRPSSRLPHVYDSALADMHVVWLFNPPSQADVEETCRALEILGSIKAINTMAADSGKPYQELYFRSADSAHKGLAALDEVYDVCPAQYIASEKHPLQQRVNIPNGTVGPTGFKTVKELVTALTSAAFMQWSSLILDPITITAPENEASSFTLTIKGLPLFDRIGSLVILPPAAFHVEDTKQLEESLEEARKRYSIPIRAGAPENRAVEILNGRNRVHCYYVSGDQAVLLSIAQSPGLIVGTQICRAQLAFEYNTCQVKRNLTAPQKQAGLLSQWLAPAHIAQVDAHNSRKRPAPSAPVVTLAEEVGDSMQQD
ncbi:hypothetical protein KFL_004730080 [Klebsormidium nitens]|uniref:Uncharacterized protein n=1 Tax=Klebsormidium nitens TaxID=105231 RepID=A0A1Y1IDG1_KLENI|nr:hypothetical protein KFL_004730080 [Klebsormidium nitens]|eukprot:GAQ88960.1 hypothetical protein KFL_004730080 [Klebsormidium nitens]